MQQSIGFLDTRDYIGNDSLHLFVQNIIGTSGENCYLMLFKQGVVHAGNKWRPWRGCDLTARRGNSQKITIANCRWCSKIMLYDYIDLHTLNANIFFKTSSDEILRHYQFHKRFHKRLLFNGIILEWNWQYINLIENCADYLTRSSYCILSHAFIRIIRRSKKIRFFFVCTPHLGTRLIYRLYNIPWNIELTLIVKKNCKKLKCVNVRMLMQITFQIIEFLKILDKFCIKVSKV